jgi:peptidoglycan/xylan/chitin deacetylase (PgdA/CDA1 family)
MNNPKFPCKNHPQQYSSHKCYYCHAYICRECQRAAWHHIFCGRWCIYRYIWSVYLAKIIRRPEFLYMLIIVVTLQIILYFSLRQILTDQVSLRPAVQPADTSQLSELTVDSAFNPQPNMLQIRGDAPANTILGLWHNGQFVTSTISYTQRYIFQTQYLYPGPNEFVIWAFSDQGKVFKLDSVFINYFSARLALLASPIDKFNTENNYLALTFDAGSTTNGADSILQILEKGNVRCTFFLTGDFIKSNPQMVIKLAGLGHELSNHTYNHPHLTNWEQDRRHTTAGNVDRFFIQQQLQRTDSLYYILLNQHLKPFWRAPYGEFNAAILQWAAEIGYRHIGWTAECDSRDWVADRHDVLYLNPEQLYQHWMALEQAGKLKGAIILLHLGTERKSDFIYPVLAKFIDQLQKKNYQLLTISQLLGVTDPL